MTDNVELLKPAKNRPVEGVIEELKNALKLAEAGNLRSIGMVGLLSTKATFRSYCTDDNIKLVGQLETLKITLIEDMVAEDIPEPEEDE